MSWDRKRQGVKRMGKPRVEVEIRASPFYLPEQRTHLTGKHLIRLLGKVSETSAKHNERQMAYISPQSISNCSN